MTLNNACLSGPQCDSNNNSVDAAKSGFFSLSPIRFSLLSSIIGILLINRLSLDQQNSLGNFIVNVGQAILTAAAQGAALQSGNQQNDRISQQIKLLKKEIELLERELKL